MTPERAAAYTRVMRTVRDLGPAKLLPQERELVTEVADNLVLASDPPGATANVALLDAGAVVRHLVDSGRWTRESAERLHDDLRACGPWDPESLPRAA
jgi:hypothetical protein